MKRRRKRLTMNEVQEIRWFCKNTSQSYKSVGARFHIDATCISEIVRNHTYRDENYDSPNEQPKADRQYMYELSLQKYSFEQIARMEKIRTGRDKIYSISYVKKCIGDFRRSLAAQKVA